MHLNNLRKIQKREGARTMLGNILRGAVIASVVTATLLAVLGVGFTLFAIGFITENEGG